MTLEKYIQGLNEYAKENPEALSLEVITSKDDEGNGYNYVHYTPSKGAFEDGDFVSFDSFDEYDMEDGEVNAVCVN